METRVPVRARLSPVSRTRNGRIGGNMLRRKSMAAWEKDSKNRCTAEPLCSDVNHGNREDQPMAVTIDPTIFREYDIRGVVDTQFGPDVVRILGRALAQYFLDAGQKEVLVGRDN